MFCHGAKFAISVSWNCEICMSIPSRPWNYYTESHFRVERARWLFCMDLYYFSRNVGILIQLDAIIDHVTGQPVTLRLEVWTICHVLISWFLVRKAEAINPIENMCSFSSNFCSERKLGENTRCMFILHSVVHGRKSRGGIGDGHTSPNIVGSSPPIFSPVIFAEVHCSTTCNRPFPALISTIFACCTYLGR